MTNRMTGLNLRLNNHREYFLRAMGDEDTATQMPLRTQARIFGNPLTQPATQVDVTPLGKITKIEITQGNPAISGHQIVDVYRGKESRTYPIMDSEPMQQARTRCLIARCAARGIEIVGVGL